MRRFNDAVVQSRVDKRMLATVTSYYLKSGMIPRTVSELVREVLDGFVEVLVQNGKVELVEDTESARQLLDSVYGSRSFNSGGRGLSNEYRNLALDDVERRPNIVFNDPGYEKTVKRLMSEEERNAEKKRVLDSMRYDKDGLAINDTRDSGKVVDSDLDKWGRADVKESSKVQDRNDQCTMRELSDGEVEEKIRLDKERLAKEMEEIRGFDPRSMAIKDGDL